LRSVHVAVVGHITKDLVRIPGKPDREQEGGSAYYVSVALRSLGCDVTVVTRIQRAEEDLLLRDLVRRGIHVRNTPSPETTVFENVYTDATLTSRQQWVRSVAQPISAADVEGIRADAFHVGPLTRDEISVDVLRTIRAQTPLVAFDAQGMLRQVVDGRVSLAAWPELDRALPFVDVLKVDDAEAFELVGTKDATDAAAREVLVTFANRGSLVRASGASVHVDVVRPRANVDATGCGDTYVAGYLHARLAGEPPPEAARFAAAAASLKLERYGPFEGTAADVRAHLARA
jgi:sugar/nucleoside kinase (ribokinase family)